MDSIQRKNLNVNSNTIYTVYWVHKASHTNPYTEGYVGVTKRDPKQRLYEHVQTKRLPDECELDLLATGLTEDQAYELEIHYRPTWYIGWNVSKGGWHAERPKGIHTSGWKHSPESRALRAKKSMGNTNGRHKAKPVIVDGVEYPNAKAAAKSIGLNYKQVYNRLRDSRFPNFQYK